MNSAWWRKTWNPVTGCTPVSAGCENCWAKRQHGRFSDRPFSEITLHLDRLYQPLRWCTPQRVAVCLMGDLFHPDVPISFIADVFNVMSSATTACRKLHRHDEECWTGDPHSFFLLTKRPERALEILRPHGLLDEAIYNWSGEEPLCIAQEVGHWPLPNLRLGVSVEDQPTADRRIPLLLQTPAAFRYVSYEPALGPVDFRAWTFAEHGRRLIGAQPGISWLIAGGESGPHARPCSAEWIRSAVQQCQAAKVPVFVKQWGSNPFQLIPLFKGRPIINGTHAGGVHFRLGSRSGSDPAEWPEDLRVRDLP